MSRQQTRNEGGEKAAEQGTLSLELIHVTLRKFGVEVPDSMGPQIMEYIDLLTRWNQKISLTSVTEPALLLERHFGESLFGAISAGIESGSLLDVGSGAGFPSLPIALFCPKVTETLLEPNGKKTAFLWEVCRSLALATRVTIVRSRLEDFSPSTKYSFITSRAVAVSEQFLEHCARLLESNGKLVLWLAENEVKSAEQNSLWSWNPPIKIPGSDRRFVFSGKPKAK